MQKITSNNVGIELRLNYIHFIVLAKVCQKIAEGCYIGFNLQALKCHCNALTTDTRTHVMLMCIRGGQQVTIVLPQDAMQSAVYVTAILSVCPQVTFDGWGAHVEMA